jgi:hypothetical protein
MIGTDKKIIQCLIKEWQSSGESKSGFAARKGISRATFYYWTKKHQHLPLKRESMNGFQSITIAEHNIASHVQPTAVIHYPSGARLELHVPLEGSLLKFLIE